MLLEMINERTIKMKTLKALDQNFRLLKGKHSKTEKNSYKKG